MRIPPLCIIQARLHSTRLPHKMLLKLGDETLIARAWRVAGEAFGRERCIVAIPEFDVTGPLADELAAIGAYVRPYAGVEWDVLGRFHYAAHCERWHPDSVIVRYTPDDPHKMSSMLRTVAAGVRLPVELGGEAFTLAMLDRAQSRVDAFAVELREHITDALFPFRLPPYRPGEGFTIDTAADYEAAQARLAAP